jgi:hypothetical protein
MRVMARSDSVGPSIQHHRLLERRRALPLKQRPSKTTISLRSVTDPAATRMMKAYRGVLSKASVV